MTDDDRTYLDRYARRQLDQILATIPAVLEDLINVEVKTARINKPGLAVARRPKKLGASLPYHAGAAERHDQLHATLQHWVQVVLDQQGGQPPHAATLALAAWLRKRIYGLALCEGSAAALDDITDRVQACRRIVDLPPDDYVVIDEQRVREANRSVVTLSTVSVIAARLGDVGRGLNRDRLRTLAKHGKVAPDSVDPETGTKFYKLGDVLHAHHAHRTRRSQGA